MYASILSIGASSAFLLAVLFLFRIESRLGRRIIGSRFRSYLDQRLSQMKVYLLRSFHRFGFRAVRMVFHYLTHVFLTVMLRLVRGFESTVVRLQLRNRAIARTVRTKSEKTHLDHIADHKLEQALSDREKHLLKRRSLG